MDALPQNLFQLMLTLSRLENSNMIAETFLKTMNSIFREVQFFILPKGETTPFESIDIKTSYNNFGKIALEYNQFILPVSKKQLIYSAADILAILLENRMQQDKLALEKNQIKKQWLMQNENFHELDEQYAVLAGNSEDMIFRFDRSFNIIYANNCAEKTFEIQGLSLINKNVKELDQTFEEKDFWTRNLERIFSLGISINDNLVLIKSSGKLYYDVRFVPEKAEDGEINNVFATARDITELKTKEEALYESQWHLKQAQRIAKTGSWEWNLIQNNIILSDELCHILGLTPQSIAQDINEIRNFISSQLFNSLIQFQDNLPVNFKNFELEIDVKRTDNKIRHCVVCGEPILDNTGKLKKLHGTLQDISERQQMESELKSAKIKAEESDRLKSAFLANMSHEIRTPLNGILGFSELLKHKNLTADKRQFYTDIICSNGKQLLSIISDIIDISRIESGQIVLERTKCFTDNIFRELKEFLKIELKAKGKSSITPVFEEDPSYPALSFLCDEIHLKQILFNLTSNAIKFTNTGQIKCGYQIKKSNIEFYVSDTGIGIKPEYHGLIFERFRQANESVSREHGGTGLGLAICKQLVELMNGNIWVTSREEEGSEFRFSLPLESTEIIEKFPQTDIVQNDYSWPGKKILIVEDDSTSFQLLAETLSDTYAIVYHADDGEKAMLMYQTIIPNIILMDIRIPKINGLDVIKTIRKTDKDVLIIAITANAFVEDKISCMEAGSDEYISKPLNRNELLSKIESLIKNSVKKVSSVPIAEL